MPGRLWRNRGGDREAFHEKSRDRGQTLTYYNFRKIVICKGLTPKLHGDRCGKRRSGNCNGHSAMPALEVRAWHPIPHARGFCDSLKMSALQAADRARDLENHRRS